VTSRAIRDRDLRCRLVFCRQFLEAPTWTLLRRVGDRYHPARFAPLVRAVFEKYGMLGLPDD
jgi:hypothetical protein